MSDVVIAALIASIAPTFVAFLSLLKSRKNGTAIQEIHLTMNSRLDQLVEASVGKAQAEGREQGRAEKEQ